MDGTPGATEMPTISVAQFHSLAEAAFATDAGGRLRLWNRAATDLLGWSAEEAVGRGCADLLRGVDENGDAVCREPCPMLAGIGPPGRPALGDGAWGRAGWRPDPRAAVDVPQHPDMVVRRRDESRAAVTAVAVPVIVEGTAALVHLLRGVPAAEVDPLTGTLQRRAFAVRAADEQHRATRRGEPLSVALVDIDLLKEINDRDGHVAGDAAVVLVAQHLREGRREDLVARWGGDEFVVLMPGATRPAAAARMRRALRRLRTDAAARGMPTSFSAGVAELRATESLEACLLRADAALYRAKTSGRESVHTAGLRLARTPHRRRV